MQFNIIFKTIFEYIHKKFRFVHTNTFCKYRKKLRASPRVHLVMYVYTLSYFVNKQEIWWLYLSSIERCTVVLKSQPMSHFRENFEKFCNFSIKMYIFSNIYLCLSDK